jgi:hypothetical protein
VNVLTLTSRVVRNPDLVSADMDGEIVMMSLERGEYYGIGGVGTRVWQLLEQPMTLDQICRTMCSEFEVDESKCRTDMLAFVSDLARNGMVLPG